MTSYSKRLQNELALDEENSDRKVPSEKYYVLVVSLDASTPKQTIEECATTLVAVNSTVTPSITYIYGSTIYYLYSAVDEKREHLLGGSHQRLCSEFSSVASLISSCLTTTHIVELETRSRVIAYFCLKSFENVRHSLVSLSKGKVSKKDVAQYTLQECIDMFDKKSGLIWGTLSARDRYGLFIRGVGKDAKRSSIALDFKDVDTLNTFLF